MTKQEHRWAQLLAGCRMLPGSYAKRFVRDMAGQQPGDKPLSEKQRKFLGDLVFRYRRQLKIPTDEARQHREKIQMPMTLDESFLAAILADPSDETPRLIYADWLEERGDSRGEFIRIQCALAKLPPPYPLMPQLLDVRLYQRSESMNRGGNVFFDEVYQASFVEGTCHENQLSHIPWRSDPLTDLGQLGRGSYYCVRVEQQYGDGQVFLSPKCILTVIPPRSAHRTDIRCRLQLLPLEPDEQKAEDLRQRERELLKKHGPAIQVIPS